MAVLTLRRYGDPVLRQVAQPVAEITPDVKALVADMIETMWREVGVGLAAPQVGVSLRIFVMDDGKRGARVVINPVLAERSGTAKEEEGCLSVPGVFADVERSHRLRVSGLDADGQPVELDVQGLQAKIVQHEIDHLDGMLFIDRLPPVMRDRIKKKIQKEGFAQDRRRRPAFAL
jgi:peptide deformylase